MKEEAKTLEAVNQDYYHHAIQIGHKLRLKDELESNIKQFDTDIQSHMGELKKINQQAVALQAKKAEQEKVSDEAGA